MNNLSHQRNSDKRRLVNARDYLRDLENVANHGRASDDPAEVAATLRVFAEPSEVLKKLAEASRRLQ